MYKYTLIISLSSVITSPILLNLVTCSFIISLVFFNTFVIDFVVSKSDLSFFTLFFNPGAIEFY